MMSTRLLTLLLAVSCLSGCAANAQAKSAPPRQAITWTAPAGDPTYKTPEDAARAYDTVKMLAGSRTFRYAGQGKWEIMENGLVARAVVIGGSADIDWKQD